MRKVMATIIVTLFLASMAIIAMPVRAAVLVVPDVYPTIQAAIVAAGPGDTIFVKAGLYYEQLTFSSGKYGITLLGESGTILDGTYAPKKDWGWQTSGILLQGGVYDITISHFEIRNFTGDYAGGIYAWRGSPVNDITITHCFIHDNYDGIVAGPDPWDPPYWGAAAPGGTTDPTLRHTGWTISHNRLIDNHYHGIGLWTSSEATIVHNVIFGNGHVGGLVGWPPVRRPGNGDGVTCVVVENSIIEHNVIKDSASVGLSLNGVQRYLFSALIAA